MISTANGDGGFRFRLNPHTGVPVYRQIIDQVLGGIASGALTTGHQLPTVRQVAVDLAINPNTVVRAYRELEIRGVIESQQGMGTFVAHKKVRQDEVEHQRQLTQIVTDVVARAGSAGFTVQDLIAELQALAPEAGRGKTR